MIRFSVLPRAALAAGAAAALTLGLLGCAKKLTSVDAGATVPEGTPSIDARILVKPDIPIQTLEYFDGHNAGGPTPVDTLFYTPYDTLDVGQGGQVLQARYTTYASRAGAVEGTILDHTVASGYQVLRRESNGGFRVDEDFTIQPTRRWLETQWEAYNFADAFPSSFRPSTYVGRGFVSNGISAASPLTNPGIVLGSAIDTLFFDYKGFIDFLALPDSAYTPPDSIFGLHWARVAGAAGYWIQIYQFKGDAAEQVRSSLPASLYLGQSRDFFVGFVPAPADSYRLGNPGAQVLTRRPILNHQDYFARITAVDATGQLLAHSYGRPTRVPGPARNTWEIFWRGAILIRPGPKVQTTPLATAAAARR